MLKDRMQQVRDKVAELVLKANSYYGITLPDIEIRFDLRGRTAGWAGCRDGKRITDANGMMQIVYNHYFMRFNTDMMMTHWDDMFSATVPHELAHIVCYFKPSLGHKHDSGWRRVCLDLGGNGKRCHNNEVTYAKGRTFQYTTRLGYKVILSETRHNRVQAGKDYTWRKEGLVNKSCSFVVVGAPTRTATSTPSWTPTPAMAARAQLVELTPGQQEAAKLAKQLKFVTGTVSRLQLRMKIAKLAGEDTESVIQFCMTDMGMTRLQAQQSISRVPA